MKSTENEFHAALARATQALRLAEPPSRWTRVRRWLRRKLRATAEAIETVGIVLGAFAFITLYVAFAIGAVFAFIFAVVYAVRLAWSLGG